MAGMGRRPVLAMPMPRCARTATAMRARRRPCHDPQTMGRPSPKTPIAGGIGVPSDGSPPLFSCLSAADEVRVAWVRREQW
jgi:hypothetical protein